jgi:hypothetical protein
MLLGAMIDSGLLASPHIDSCRGERPRDSVAMEGNSFFDNTRLAKDL